MNHPSIIGSIKAPTAGRPVGSGTPSGAPISAQTYDISRRAAAEDGSRRLAARICQYHAKHHKSAARRQWWARRGREISFVRK